MFMCHNYLISDAEYCKCKFQEWKGSYTNDVNYVLSPIKCLWVDKIYSQDIQYNVVRKISKWKWQRMDLDPRIEKQHWFDDDSSYTLFSAYSFITIWKI